MGTAIQAFWELGRPRAILLVTGPGGRAGISCDRALQLAHQWKARVIHLHVGDADGPPPALDGVRADTDKTVDGADLRYEVVVKSGDVGDEAVRMLAETTPELLVMEADCQPTVDGLSPISPADRLVRACTSPVLFVKQPVAAPYSRILVATDYSRQSATGLETLSAFPLASVVVAHVYHEPLQGWRGSTGELTTSEMAARSARQRFLADLTPSQRARFDFLHQHGTLPDTLTQAVRDRRHDLAVIGRIGSGDLGLSLLGRTGQALIASLPCDILIAPKVAE